MRVFYFALGFACASVRHSDWIAWIALMIAAALGFYLDWSVHMDLRRARCRRRKG
jgi:hypothetical protein